MGACAEVLCWRLRASFVCLWARGSLTAVCILCFFSYVVETKGTPGTIDADYRGPIGIILINHGKEAFTINRGERIAQMVINKVAQAEWNVVPRLCVDNLKMSLFQKEVVKLC